MTEDFEDDSDIGRAVAAHIRYISMGRLKVGAMAKLDNGAANGPDHDEFTRRIKALREQGRDV